MKYLVFAVAAAALATVAAAPAAEAGIIYDNLAAPSGGTALVAYSGVFLADSFSTGASAVSLTDVKLLLSADVPTDGGQFGVGLLADASTSPGGLISLLTIASDSSLGTSLGVFDVPVASITLAANTRYWIGVQANSFLPSSLEWSFSSTSTGVGVANEFNYFDDTVFANDEFTPYQMQVSVGVVPEPGAWMLMLTGIAAAGSAIRLSRRKALASA